jgi:hypothetical protein
MANLGDATHQIYKALREVNRLDISARERFEFLELVGEPLVIILPALKRYFSNQSYPLPFKGRKIARLSSQLQAEMVIGYRHIFTASKKAGWLSRSTINKLLPACIHRILHYLNGILSNYRQVYETYPPGLWEYAHRLYRRSEKAGKLSDKVISPAHDEHSTTLMQEYLKLLLLSLIPPHQLRLEEAEEVMAGMDIWTDMSRIVDVQHDELLPTLFYVRLDVDMAPAATFDQGAAGFPSEARLRHINTMDLIAHIRALLLGEGNRIDVGNGVRVSRKTLTQLLEYWSGPKARSQERFASPDEVGLDVVIGMSAIHTQIKLAAEKEVKGRDAALMAADDELLPSWMEDTGEWDIIELNSAEEPGAWWQGIENHHPGGMIESTVLNSSKDGYCISLPVARIEQIYEGELLGLRRNGEKFWHIAAIHWLKDMGDGHLNVGIQVVALDAFPVVVKINRGVMGISEPIESFIATNEEMDSIIFLPYLPGITSKELLLEHKAHVTPLELFDKVTGSPTFEAYSFAVSNPPPVDFEEDEYRGLWLRV